MADGTLRFDTDVNTTGAQTGMSTLKTIFKTGMIAIATKITKDIVGMGISYNAQMEQYHASFETMLGSAEKASKHTEDLKKMAAKTPFEMGDLAGASQTLQAFGVDVNDVEGSLQILGDISQGNRDKFNSLALVFGQVKSQGKLMGQDLMQMINAGFNPLNVISKQTGESMESLKDKMSKGQISFEMVEEAMKSATSEGGMFYGAMEKQSKTLVGQLSTLKDNAKEFLGELTKPASTFITDVVLPKAIDGVGWMMDNLPIVKAVIASVASAITVGFAINKFATISKAIKGVGLAIKTFMVANPIMLVAAAIAALVVGLAIFTKSGGDIDALAAKIVNVASQMSVTIPKVVSKIAGKLPGIISNLVGMLGTVLPPIIKAGVTIVLALASGLLQALPQIMPAIIQLIMGLATALLDNLPMIIDVGIKILMALIDGIVNAIPALVAAIPVLINGLVTAIVTNLPTIIEAGIKIIIALIDGLIEALPTLVAALPQIILAIAEGFLTLLGAILEVGVKLLQKLWDGISSWSSTLWNNVVSFASTIPEAIKSGIGSLLGIGANWLAGLWNGIKSKKDWILDKISGIGGAILNKVKSVFGIHSPSKVMAWVGRMLDEGLGNGIDDNTRYVLKKVGNQANAIMDSYSGNLGGFTPSLPSLNPNVNGLLAYRTGANGNSNSSNQTVVNQTVNINQPVSSPHETSKAMRREAVILGLAGV